MRKELSGDKEIIPEKEHDRMEGPSSYSTKSTQHAQQHTQEEVQEQAILLAQYKSLKEEKEKELPKSTDHMQQDATPTDIFSFEGKGKGRIYYDPETGKPYIVHPESSKKPEIEHKDTSLKSESVKSTESKLEETEQAKTEHYEKEKIEIPENQDKAKKNKSEDHNDDDDFPDSGFDFFDL